jgi:apolipoprotein N-acyltransferase
VLVAGAFPPWDLYWLAWFALVPWISGLERLQRWQDAAWQGFWLSVTVGLSAAPWMAIGLHEFLMLSWPLAILGWILFAATCAQPHFVFFAIWFHWVQRTLRAGGKSWTPLALAGLALGYVGFDWAVPRLFDVGLGVSLHSAEWLRQLADLGGVSLLSFVVVSVNLLFWQMARSWRSPGRDWTLLVGRAVCVALLWGAGAGYGGLRSRTVADRLENPERTLRVSVVQGSVPNGVRLAWAGGDDGAAERQLAAYMRPTERLIEEGRRPDLVVWPEASFPGVFRQPVSRAQQGRAVKFDRQVLRLNVPIAFGAYDVVESADRRTLFNSLFSITPNYQRRGSQGLVESYRKHDLLPIAETLPGFSESGWLRTLLPSVPFFGQGQGARLLRIVPPEGEALAVVPIICSESLRLRNVLDGARGGGQVILNVGSDGWFASAAEAEFHLAIARFRSIETRLPQVRAANSGISALISATGEVVRRSKPGEETVLDLEAPIVPIGPTIVTVWGDWFGPLAGIAGAGFAVLLRRHAVTKG